MIRMGRRNRVGLTLSVLLYFGTALSNAAETDSLAADSARVATADGPFVVAPDELTKQLVFGSCTADAVSTALHKVRKSDPDAVVIAVLTERVTVNRVPLTIPSRTCLLFAEESDVWASDDAGAECLIEISDAEMISLASPAGSVRLNGRNKVDCGLKIRRSGKIHCDGLQILGCKEFGMDYRGRGQDRFADCGSVTRSHIQDCGHAGLVVRDAAQFLCLDNTVETSRAVGIDIESAQALVAGNTISSDRIALKTGGAGLVVTRNSLHGKVGDLMMLDSARGCLISENTFESSGMSVEMRGSANSVFRNTFARVSDPPADAGDSCLSVDGSSHTFVANINLQCSAFPADKALFLDPPKHGLQDVETPVVAGMGRFDLTVRSSNSSPTRLSDLQDQLAEARTKHPEDVIVARLKGEFVADDVSTGLQLPRDCFVLLDGVIRPVAGLEDEGSQLEQLILMPPTGIAGISGGVLDGGSMAQHVVNAPGDAVILLDDVTIRNSGFNGVTTKNRHNLARPMFLHGCRVVNNRNRGVWIHVCRSVHAIRNVCDGNGADGIDFDAYGRQSTALFNKCAENGRHGVFVEEPGTADNTIYGNQLHSNRLHAICLYNSSKEKPLARNLMACNECSGGISVRALMHDNVLFNNVITNGPLLGGMWSSRETYVSQNVTKASSVSVKGSGPFFCTPGPRMLGRNEFAQTAHALADQ